MDLDTPTNTMDVYPDPQERSTPSVESFARNFCTATIGRHESGGYFLEVSCDMSTPAGRRQFAKTVDLTPFVDMVTELQSLQGESISGPLMYAIGAVSQEAAVSLFKDVAPILAYSTPWGAFVKAAVTVMDAKKGSKPAQEKIRRVREAAYEGNDAARNLSNTISKIQSVLDESKATIVMGHDPYMIDSSHLDEMDVGALDRYRHGDQHDTEVGRFFKVPYREPLAAIAEGNPGAGITFRALYARGARAPGKRRST